ncbi:MAG: Calx-beta domain-containing protein [Fuerstiella sp.]
MKRKSARSRLKIEQLEARINLSAVDIGFGTGNFDFNVAGYNIEQNNANFATTSSAFGFSEASMTAAQAVDTLNGGTEMAALSDAFDGFMSWGIPTAAGAPTQNTYHDADGIVDITPTPTGTRVTTTPGTTLTGDPNDTGLDGNSFNGLELSQQWTVFALNPTTPIIRGLFVATNPTSAPITQQLGMFNNLGSDSNTRIFSTSDGDTTFSPGTDHWVGSFQEFSGTTSSDIRILTVIQGPGSVTSPANTNSQFVDGDDNPRFNYDLTLQPGETQIVMAFVGLFGIRANATDVGNTVFDSNANVEANGLLDGLTDLQKSQIVNWEFRGEVSVAASPGSVAEDGAGNLEYTFTRDKTAGPLTVNFTLSGDASFNTDYTVTGATMTGNSGVVTFADGDATATVTIDPTADTTVELDETVVLTVDAGTGYVPGTTNTATATITNDDTATVSVGDVSMAEGDSGPTVFTFNVSLDNPAAENVTFDFTTVANTAVAGSDFTAISGSGVIPAGETMTTIDVEVSGDTTVERDEQFFVDVSNLRASGLSVEFAPISITQLGVFDIMGQASGVEVVGDVAYVADLSAGLVVLDISDPANITQLGVFNTPDFANSVQVVGDVAYIADGGTGLVVLNVDVTLSVRATGTITNDDTATVSVGDVTMAEGDSGSTMFTFNVSLDNPADQNVTFDFATVGDTAVAGSDFTAVSGSGVIPAGQTQTTIEIEVSGDTMLESDEQFVVELANPQAGGLAVELASATLTELGTFDTLGSAYSVQLVDDVAYVADLGGGLVVLDVSDPANISRLGAFNTPGLARSVQVVGSVAYVADDSAGLVVLDISDPANITQLGAFNTGGLALSVQVVGNLAYVADGSSGLVVLDISDPAIIT